MDDKETAELMRVLREHFSTLSWEGPEKDSRGRIFGICGRVRVELIVDQDAAELRGLFWTRNYPGVENLPKFGGRYSIAIIEEATGEDWEAVSPQPISAVFAAFRSYYKDHAHLLPFLVELKERLGGGEA